MTKIQEFSIDSLKLRIPFQEITILDKSILDTRKKLIISDATGEILSEDKIKSLSTEIKFDSYSIKVAIVNQYNLQSKEIEDVLEIYLHSKVLEGNYFDGITKNNLRLIYDKLIGAKVFMCSYETFINSSVNDIDIKYDFISDKSTFSTLCNELKSRARQSTKLGNGQAMYKNGNLTFNRRESSTLSSPFVKFYDKELEAIEKNNKFFNHFFPYETVEEDKVKNKKRIEATCKKSSDINKFFDLEHSSLSTITQITQSELKRFIGYAINKNIDSPIKIEKSLENHKNAIDIQIHIHFTNSIENQNSTFLKTLDSYLIHFEDKQMKIRIKKKCNEWNLRRQGKKIDKNIKSEIKTNNIILDIFKLLQID